FKLLAKTDLRRSGVFIRYENQSDAQMLVAAWKDAANGMNRILSVYGLGADPRYKDIDRVSYDVSTETYRNLLKAKIAEIKFSKAPLFFEPTLNFALKLLEINRRDEAGRYEPLERGENKAAVQNLRNAARLAFRYGIPTDRTALVTSSEDHITSSASDEFRTRNLNELGYSPVEFIKRISPVAAEFKPSVASLFFDANDPLDP